MRKATLLFAVLLASAISGQAAVVKYSQPYSFRYYVSCPNGGQGEIADFNGYFATVLTETRENIWIILKIDEHPVITGIGETSGATYQVVGDSGYEIKFNESLLPNFSATEQYLVNFGIVGDGGNYHFHENATIVLSYVNGVFQVSTKHDNFFVFCQ